MFMKYYYILYPFLFVFIWCFTLMITAVLGGWYKISKKYPEKLINEIGTNYYFQSMKIGYFTSYGSCINITLFEKGLLIKPIIIFAFFHKPIFIPYIEINNIIFNKIFFFEYAICFLDGKRLKFMGRFIKELKLRINKILD